MNFALQGPVEERSRVVMVLLREQKYHARSVMDWVEIEEITYKGLCLVHGIRKASLIHSQVRFVL